MGDVVAEDMATIVPRDGGHQHGVRAPGRRVAALILRIATAAIAAGSGVAQAALPEPRFDLQGHRGARGLAPENTIAGFKRTLVIGVTTLETDLAVTADGVVVIAHDPKLNPALVRGADGRWLREEGPAIHSLTLAQLRAYDIGRLNPDHRYARDWPEQQAVDGERFPTLAEFFALAEASGKPVRFNLEIKITPTSGSDTPDPATFARRVIDEVRAAGVAARTTIQSFDWRALVESRKRAPDIATACLTAEFERFNTVRLDASGASPWHAGLKLGDYGSLPKLVKSAGCALWSPNFRALDAARLKEAQQLGLKVVVWTVNDPRDMAELIELGVDGIITDYPNRLRDVMKTKGMPLP
jgi:glycerophosphoryl diester phosphodiesterase